MARTDFLVQNFNLEKQKSKFPVTFSGKIEGYYSVVEINEGGYGAGEYVIKLGLSNQTKDFSELITKLNERLTGKHRPLVIEMRSNHLVLSGTLPMRKKNVEEHLTFIIQQSVSQLNELGIETGDFLYGDTDDSLSLYRVENVYMFLSDRSYQTFKDDLESQQFGEANKKSIQAGLGGAFFGALIGAVIWGILLYIGFLGWIAGIISVFLAFHFYRKNNGLFNLSGVLTVVGIVILTLLLANYIVYALIVYLSLQEFGFTFSAVFLNLIPILREAELMSAFLFDMILGVGIAGLYGAAATYRIYQSAKGDGTIQKI